MFTGAVDQVCLERFRMIISPTVGRHDIGEKYVTNVTKVKKFRGRENTSKEVEC